VGDHEIDRADAEQYDHEIVKEAEIGAKVGNFLENEVFGSPDEAAYGQEGIEGPGFLFEESPDVELPGDEDPFQQIIAVDGYGIAAMVMFDEDEADDFGNEADPQQYIEGLIVFANTAQAYQPRYDR
jgi:hypothetical protein